MNATAIISAVTAFAIGAGGVLTGAATSGKLSTSSIVIALVFGLIAGAKDLRSLYKLPPVDGAGPAPGATAALMLLCALGLGALAGCAAIQPGADPFVVRVEQGQSGASATFDLVLNEDQANRGFWLTNAPALHNFCEWLRTPTPYAGVTNVPRCVAIQLNLDDIKQAYKTASTASNSNLLFEAFTTLSTAVSQATSWEYIIQHPTH